MTFYAGEACGGLSSKLWEGKQKTNILSHWGLELLQKVSSSLLMFPTYSTMALKG